MTTDINELTPAYATSPGEVLKDELRARKMTKRELAKKMGVSESLVVLLIRGDEVFYASNALKLDRALEIDAEVWLNLQHNYWIDIEKLRHKHEVELLTKLRNKKKKRNGKDQSNSDQSSK